MKLDAALDASATIPAICIVNSLDGTIVLETSIPTDPEAIFGVLELYAPQLYLVGHEATGWSAWLHRELEARGMPMVLLETHHSAPMTGGAAQQDRPQRRPRPGATGALALIRAGAHQERCGHPDKLFLALRRALERKLMDIETEVWHSLKMFGLMPASASSAPRLSPASAT